MRSEAPSLGAGLIGIGREWGHVKTAIPTESEARNYLTSAYQLGIRFFDTAPSYGSSEERLGNFFHSLTQDQRSTLTIATKFGEHWDAARQEPFTDHSYQALVTSIDQSVTRLGIPNVLLLHKTTPEVLESDEVKRAFEYAREKGIKEFGASVSDLQSAEMVLDNPIFSYIQVPYNASKTDFSKVIDNAHARGKKVVINRPFNMGADIYTAQEDPHVTAYKFVLQKLSAGDVVLTGTKSVDHLRENLKAFQIALHS